MTRNQEKKIKQMVDKWLEAKGGTIEEREHRSAAWMKYFSELKVPKPVYLLAAATWLCSGAVILPEDMPKVEQAVRVAEINKVDPLRYDRPMAVIDAFPSTEIKEAPIDPNTVPTLHLERKFDSGLAIYNVDDSQESHENMRKIINTHFGKDSSPWCLLQGDSQGNLTDDARFYWSHYNAYPKQVAFIDGKLVAFSANDNPKKTWWNRMDKSSKNITMFRRKIKGDRLGRVADMEFDSKTGNVTYNDIHRYGPGGWGKECYTSLEDTVPKEIQDTANPDAVYVRIPDSVTKIGWRAFYNYPSLQEIHIPAGVTKIDACAFKGCSSLQEVHIPDNVTQIGNEAFCGCTSLRKIHIPAGVTWIGHSVFKGCKSLQEIHIPDSVTKIGNGAFADCPSLQEIRIPDSVAEIGYATFRGCTSLREIHIPAGVTEIGISAFSGCSSLREIHIPAGVTKIGMHAFNDCSSLREIHIPDGITWIHDSAFRGCFSLWEVRIPDGVTRIDDGAFCGCTSLRKVHIPAGVRRIGRHSFRSCRSLQEISIPDGVTAIDRNAFKRCTSLREVRVSATAPLSFIERLEECIPQQCVITRVLPKIDETELAVLKEYGVSDKAIKTLQEKGCVNIKENTFYRRNTPVSPCPENLRNIKTDILVVNKDGRLFVKAPDGTGNLGAVSSFFEKFKKRSGFIPKKPVAATQEVKTLKIK